LNANAQGDLAGTGVYTAVASVLQPRPFHQYTTPLVISANGADFGSGGDITIGVTFGISDLHVGVASGDLTLSATAAPPQPARAMPAASP